MAEVIQINSNTWRLEEEGVRFFLLAGSEKALLVDTGMKSPNAKELAQSVTDLPLELCNTHADMDHTSGNAAFDTLYLSPAEEPSYRSYGGKGTVKPVKEGDIIDLGGRPLEVIDLPGHTPGSIALLDVNSGALIGGDAIQDGGIFLFGPTRDVPAYTQSLKDLMAKHSGRFTEVYTSHGTFPMQPSIIPQIIAGAEAMQRGELTGTPVNMFGHEAVSYNIGCATLLWEH